MSTTASVELDTILEPSQEQDNREYGSGLSGIPMPDVEEITLQCSGLGEFGELDLKEIDNPEPRPIDPVEKTRLSERQVFMASVHKLSIEPLDAPCQPVNQPEFHAAEPLAFDPDVFAEPGQNHSEQPAQIRVSLSPEQSNALNFKAIAEAFLPVESDLSVIPEVADCIRWLKQPLYNATMDDGRLFITANHPSLKLISALIDYGHTIESVRDPAFRRLTVLVQYAATLNAKDFQKYSRFIGQVKQAVAQADSPRQKVTSWLYSQSERVLPQRQPALRTIEFNRTMLRYELAVHRLMRAIWPLVLTKLDKQFGRQSEAFQSAFFAYGNVLRSTQVMSKAAAKHQLLESLPSTIAQLLQVFNRIQLKEVIREEIIFRLMELHLAIVRGQDGTAIREHQMDAAYAFRCLKGNVFDEKEYQRLFNADGRLSAVYFEKLVKRVRSQDRRLTELEEYTIASYRSVVSTEPVVKEAKVRLPQPDFGLLIKRTVGFLIDPPFPAFPQPRYG